MRAGFRSRTIPFLFGAGDGDGSLGGLGFVALMRTVDLERVGIGAPTATWTLELSVSFSRTSRTLGLKHTGASLAAAQERKKNRE